MSAGDEDFSFCVSENIFISLLAFWNIFLLGIEFEVDDFFSISTLKIFLHYLLASVVSN